MESIPSFIDSKNSFAIIGASNNGEKYGNQVYRDLRESGRVVYPVNPKEESIEGDKCYSSLNSLLESRRVDIVITVVQPEVTLEIARICKSLGIKRIWMQPGSESEEAVDFCEKNGIECIHDMCIMVERRNR